VLRSAVRGDMFIQVAVETPKQLTKRQREILDYLTRNAGTR
jgi:molecular chaperone DnaJ